MPEETYEWLPKGQLLDFEELERVVRVFARLGVDRVRLTGGEPLLRRDLSVLVAKLTAIPALAEVTLTTNAIHLSRQAVELKRAGLSRITVSLDTLRTDRFRELTKRDEFGRVMAGIDAAREAGFRGTKLNAVVMRGKNDDELGDLLRFGREHEVEVRFIEYMDVAGATRWNANEVVSRDDILERVRAEFGDVEPLTTPAAAPARRFALPDGTRFGIIASTTKPFCGDCDRARLTADGTLFTCLYATRGHALRELVRSSASDDELHTAVSKLWTARDDQGAVDRASSGPERSADWVPLEDLRKSPQVEMHTKGG